MKKATTFQAKKYIFLYCIVQIEGSETQKEVLGKMIETYGLEVALGRPTFYLYFEAREVLFASISNLFCYIPLGYFALLYYIHFE